MLVALAVAFDFSGRRTGRNVDLVLMLALGLMFFDMMRFFRIRLDPAYWRLLDLVYSVGLRPQRRAPDSRAVAGVVPLGAAASWQPNLRGRPLAAIALVLVACDVLAALARTPDDSGYFINLGAQRLRERGRLPYGDPLLTGNTWRAHADPCSTRRTCRFSS